MKTLTEKPKAVPHVIHPNAVYFVEQVQEILRLKRTTVRREIRTKRLKVARRAGRYFFLGSWLLEWIRTGEKSLIEAARHDSEGVDQE